MTTAMGTGMINPDTVVSTFGLLGILATVFVESGLLLGFFLPGDSLLFTRRRARRAAESLRAIVGAAPDRAPRSDTR